MVVHRPGTTRSVGRVASGRSALVVGAGLAGLAAARTLVAAGWSVRVLEAERRPGGRIASDDVDGFTVDRGFQVLNSAYPELQRLGALAHTADAVFGSGALLHRGGRLHRVVDPRDEPTAAPAALTAPIGSLREKAVLGAFLAECGYASTRRIRRRRDVEFREQLRRWRLDGTVTERFIRPFLAGVLLEDELTTSQRFVDLVWRTFARGDVYVPGGGMQRFPEVLAGNLPAGTVEYGVRVHAVRPGEVDTDDGTARADAVVVAADPHGAAGLLGWDAPAMNAVTTVWHAAPTAPTRDKLIVLDTEGGPLVNTVVMSNVAPAYSPDGRALVASSFLGVGTVDEPTWERELARLWGTGVADWDLVAVTEVPHALPALPGGSPLRKPVRVADRLFVAGDWRDTPSTQGALVSGRRTAAAVIDHA